MFGRILPAIFLLSTICHKNKLFAKRATLLTQLLGSICFEYRVNMFSNVFLIAKKDIYLMENQYKNY